MADEDLLSQAKNYFFPSDVNDPRVNSALRQRIALSLMSSASRKGYPKTIGEGLSAIGDAIGDRAMANRLMQADLAQQDAAKAQVSGDSEDKGPLAYAPEEDTPAPTPTQNAAPAAPAVPPVTAAALPPVVPSTPPATAAPPTPAATPPPIDPNAPPDFSARFAGTGEPTGAPAMADARTRLAAALAAQRTAQGVPQPNPTQGGPGPSPTPMPLAGGLADQQAALTPTNIQPAPPPPPRAVQPQVAQGPPAPDYAYVMPPVKLPPAPAPTPPSARELQLMNAVANNPGNPYVAQRAAPALALEQARRAALDKQNSERYTAAVTLARELELKRQEQIATQAQRGLEGRKGEQSLSAPVDIEGKYVPVPGQPGTFRTPTIIGQDPNAPPQVKMNEQQSNSVKFANQMYDAGHDIDAKALTNPKDAAASSVPLIHSWAEGQNYKGAQGAAVRWIMGKLRSESGATINPDEFAREYKAFIPVVNDSPAVIAQKAQARATAMESMRAAAGPGSAHIDYHARQDANDQQRLAVEMADMVKQTGKPIVPGKVYENPDQPGKRRVFDGRRWREY